MLLIPAMDIRDERFIHFLSEPIYKDLVDEDNPYRVASWWRRKGAKIIHLNDLDGAFKGKPVNLEVLRKIKKLGLSVQFSGGVRSISDIEKVLEAGADRVVINIFTEKEKKNLEKACELFGSNLILGVQSKNSIICGEGYQQKTSLEFKDLMASLSDSKIKSFLYRDVKRRDILDGKNFSILKEVLEKEAFEIFISGGISTLEELEILHSLNVYAVIIGKAFYDGQLDFELLSKKFKENIVFNRQI